jgi:hypothetical protein
MDTHTFWRNAASSSVSAQKGAETDGVNRTFFEIKAALGVLSHRTT